MTNKTADMVFSKTHEWVLVDEGGVATIGISEHAQHLLGDIVFVDLPENEQDVSAEDEVAVVESVKAASDIYSPVSGVITEVNTALSDTPELINTSPYDEGWLFRVRMADQSELDGLLGVDDYMKSLD